jgi:small subunit ribosomal protein S9
MATKETTKKKATKPKKADVESTVSEESVAAESAKGGSYIYAVGRRKTSIARVRLIKNGKGTITVNGKEMEAFFGPYELRALVKAPLSVTGNETAVDVSAQTNGGGVRGQAEAVRLGLSRALCVLNPTYRKTLKKLGYLTRDPRAKERKKPGLKRARRAPQWSKR